MSPSSELVFKSKSLKEIGRGREQRIAITNCETEGIIENINRKSNKISVSTDDRLVGSVKQTKQTKVISVYLEKKML